MDRFPYPAINRSKIEADANSRILELFDNVENYKNNIKKFIFTNIFLKYNKDDERIIPSRVQCITSSALLRSLYLRNGIVDAINSRNIISLFANLKSFIEIPAFLAYVYSILDSNLSDDEILKYLTKIELGNKGETDLRVGNIEAVNIKTMFEKLDKLVKKMAKTKTVNNKYFQSFYDVVCNASHPNYDAHSIIGKFDWKIMGGWRCLSPIEIKESFFACFDWYAPSLNMSVVFVGALSERIMKHPKIINFNELDNSLYFNE